MPRIRTIKPQHWNDRELANISLQAHLLWIGIWNFSDDEGIIESDPLLLKAQIFPRRTDIRVEQVSQWIDQLVKARFLLPLTFNGESYYVSRTFKTHQKIDRPQDSKIPKDIIRRVFDEYSTNVRGTIAPDSNVREGNVKESISPNGSGGNSPPNSPKDLENEYGSIEKTKESIYRFIKNKPLITRPYVDFWNFFAAKNSMASVKSVTEERSKKLKKRLSESEFNFIEILRKAQSSEFILLNKWFGFDWIIKNQANYLKVLEGNFDNGKPIEKMKKESNGSVEAVYKSRKEETQTER